MTGINEKNFLQELLSAIPEFKKIHDENKEEHEIGIHLVVGSLRRLAEETIPVKNDQLLDRITSFIVRCHEESKGEVNNAIFVSFFENMSEDGLKYFFEHLPSGFVAEVKNFLSEFDRATNNI